MAKKLLDDCFAHEPGRLTHGQALDILKSRVHRVCDTETLPLAKAAGRILAASATARTAVPAHTNAAMDGYAFAGRDYDGAAGSTFSVSGRVAAGHPLGGRPPKGSAVRIFTGAVMPQGLDTVVMQEDVELIEDDSAAQVRVPGGLKAGANVRLAGEDVQKGDELLAAGALIRPQDLAGLASIGLAQVTCYRPLKVAIVSTGDEIVRPGAPLGPGDVYDANSPMLQALIASAGASTIANDLGVLPDNRELLSEALLKAARSHDVIITSGSASKGEEDHLIAALDKIGKRHLWQIAIKPGRPLTFGQIGNAVLVGLPGNPVAVFVCFLLYVWPMLRVLGGAPWREPRALMLPADFDFPNRKTGRREFWRAMMKQTPGGYVAEKFMADGSGLISSLRAADGLIEIPEDVSVIRRGDLVAFIPFTEFGIAGR